MNVAEFEALLGKPPLNPTVLSAYQTLTHQINYIPEDFVAYVGQGSNNSYSVNRQKAGANTYKYSIFSLTGGYITTTVSDQIQTGGNRMNIEDLKEPVKNVVMHAVSGFLLGFSATFVVAPGNWAELSTAIYGACVVGFYGALKEVASYIETLAKPKDTKAGANVQEKKLSSRML